MPLLTFILALIFASCNGSPTPRADVPVETSDAARTALPAPADSLIPAEYRNGKLVTIQRSEAEWKALLNDQEFRVLRQEGTERAFTGDLWDNHKPGTYVCRGCGLPLFKADTKFESGSGWPSFYQPANSDYVAEKRDVSFGMVRVEVECARCGGHLGHVFDDGPRPTGLRYCINSVSLDFVPE
jgi:peptide-methionine (R)-S-oxide reductase